MSTTVAWIGDSLVDMSDADRLETGRGPAATLVRMANASLPREVLT